MDRAALRLVAPSAEHEAAYINFAAELGAHGDDRWVRAVHELGFAGYLEKKAQDERGEGLPDGIVPSSVYWLIDGQGVIHAELRLRHYLNEGLLRDGGNIGYVVRPESRQQGVGTELLRQGLKVARQRGLERALITCATDNWGSIGVIESNGGKEFTVGFSPTTNKPTRHYWIDLD